LISKILVGRKTSEVVENTDESSFGEGQLIETVNDQLKNICQIEHTRHRSKINFLVNLLAALIAYIYQEKKPSLNLHHDQIEALQLAGY